MTELNYLITVRLDRDEGLFASRDELSENIEIAIRNGVSDAVLDDLGSRGDSVYSISDIDIERMDRISQRMLNAEYDRNVEAERPTEDERQDLIRDLQQKLSETEREAARLRALIKDMQPVEGKTRVFQEDIVSRAVTYFKEAAVIFSRDGDRWHGYEVKMENDGSLRIGFNAVGMESMAIRPEVSNQIRIITVER